MLKLCSKPESIRALEQYVRQLGDKYLVVKNRFPDILISLTEAVNNAIIHGNGEMEDKCVFVEYEIVNTDCLCFSIRDEGKGFDLNDIPDPTCDENLEQLGGRGVFLMQKLSDRISFEENGSNVKMYFNLSA